jgi:hypothetical protein
LQEVLEVLPGRGALAVGPAAASIEAAPWRVLILDRSGDDPKWIIATVSVPSDVRAAEMEPGGWRYADWPDVARWVRDQVGQRARLVPLSATVWLIGAEGSAGS